MKKQIFYGKYIAIGNKNIEDSENELGGDYFDYRIFSVYIDLKNTSNIKWTYLSQKQHTFNLKTPEGLKIFGIHHYGFNLVRIAGSSRFLFGFSGFLSSSYHMDLLKEFPTSYTIYLGYANDLFDTKCKKKYFTLSEMEKK